MCSSFVEWDKSYAERSANAVLDAVGGGVNVAKGAAQFSSATIGNVLGGLNPRKYL